MKKQLLIVGIIALLVFVGLSGCTQNGNNGAERKWNEIGVLHGFLIYNGTMYLSNDFTPINLEKQDQFFHVTMLISINNYCGNLTIKSLEESIEHPEKYGDKNGSYRLDVYIPVKGNISEYPYDTYRGNITFKTTDNDEGILDFRSMSHNISISRWSVNVSGDFNQISFTFSRNEEIKTFEILEWFGIFTLIINILSFALSIIFYYKKNKKNRYGNILSFSESILFHLGNVTVIPFTIGIIFNYVIYTFPNPFSGNALTLWLLMVFSIGMGAIAFAVREGKSQKLK